MSFPDNISKHRLAVLDMLGEAFQDPAKRTVVYTRGISMHPFLRERDQIVIRGTSAAELRTGDVIAYKVGDVLVAHRVVALERRGDGLVVWEKGDNNLYLTPIEVERVLGVVAEVISGDRRRDLGSWYQRALGLGVAWYGKLAVRTYAAARASGAMLVRRGSPLSRAMRSVVYFAVLSPSRGLLWLVRYLP